MSTPELHALLEQAIAHVNAEELEEGRALLERVLEQDPQNDRAWVWLSGCVKDPMQRRICLQQALSVNPQNQAALDGMKVLDGELVQASKQPPSLLESRLSYAEFEEEEELEPQFSPSAPGEATAVSPTMPGAYEEPSFPEKEQRPRRRVGLIILAVLVLFFFVCALVVVVVLPPLLQNFAA